MRIRRNLRALAALGIVLAAGSCSPRGESLPSPFEGSREGAIQLTVDNQDWRDATVYVDWNGVRQRVGMVLGKTTETFTTPWRDYFVKIDVDFIGGGGLPAQEAIQVQSGDHLDYVIMPGW